MRRRVRKGADRGNIQLNYAVPLRYPTMIFGVAAIKPSAHNQMLMHDDQTEHRAAAEESSYRPK